jgi:hypothetical protein
MRFNVSLLVLVIAALFVSACSGTPKQSQSQSQSGAVELIAQTQDALTASDVVKVTLTVSGNGINPAIVNDLAKSGAHWTGLIGGIPTGTDRTLHADAYDASNNVVYRGDAFHVNVDTDGTAVVALLLQQASPPTPFANAVPLIDSFTASSNAIAPSHTVTLNVTAHDPDAGDTLTYAWTATDGSFSTTSSGSTVWTAPATEGAQTLTISVTDPHGAVAAMSLSVSVLNSNGSGSASVTVDLNTWPIVADVVPSPTRVNVGDSSTITLTASDPDGDPLAYAWTSACTGSFNNAAAQNPVFTIAGPIGSPSCALTVTVTDGRGGTNTGTVTLQTGPGAPIQIAPQVDNTFQSSPVARPGDVLTFKVKAHDPQNGSLTYAWAASGGTLGTVTNTAGQSQVTWTAPAACQATPFTLTVTITDTVGLSTQQKFTVTPDLATDPNNCGSCGHGCGGFSCSAGTCNMTLGFKLFGTTVRQVLAGNTAVWGSDAFAGQSGNIFQYNGTSFVGRSSSKTALALGGDGDIWTLGPQGSNTSAVFRWSSVTFGQVSNATLTEITKGSSDSNIWGLNGTSIFHFVASSSTFQPVTGTLSHIAAGGTATWGLDSTGAAMRWNGTSFVSSGATFKVDPTALIVTQGGVAWGIDANGNASFWNGSTFTPTGQAMSRVSGAADGTTWELSNGVAYAWNGTSFAQKGTAPLGTLTDISVSRSDIILACDANNKRAFFWTQCVAPKQWSGSASVCCSTQWSSTNTCA